MRHLKYFIFNTMKVIRILKYKVVRKAATKVEAV